MFNSFRSRKEAEGATVVQLPVAPQPGDTAASSRPGIDRAQQAHLELKSRMHQALLDRLNLAMIDKVDKGELRRQIGGLVAQLLQDESRVMPAADVSALVDELIFEVLGLGPLEPLLADPTVNDILVNSFDSVYVERAGVLEKTAVRFRDERHLLRIIDKIVSGVGRRIDEAQPWVDARLPDGSRVNAIIRPCAIDGPSMSIRKFAKDKMTMAKLVDRGALSQKAADLLRGLIEARMNVLISGGTGSGKTTMLNAMSSFIDPRQRIVTIEDAAELQLQQDHVVRLETRPANAEGEGAVSQRDLVRNALRMRPDRIIIGEVRGGEAFDMLQAMNTGHDGSLATVHANTPRDAMARVEQMVTMLGVGLPASTIRAQIASAVHVVVQLNRFSDGRRRVTSISELTGMEGEVITMQEIFGFRRRGKSDTGEVLGEFGATGIRPRCAEALIAAGVRLDETSFQRGDRT